MDLRYGAGKVWPAGAVMAGLYLAYWTVMLLTGAGATPEDRIPVLYIAAQFFAFCVPAAVYGYVNNPSDGIGYAMLPVRTWVKFAAMMLVSVIAIPGLPVDGGQWRQRILRHDMEHEKRHKLRRILV